MSLNENTITTKTSLSTKRLVICALFAALLCISAYLSIPTPLPMAPKITMINFVVILIALLFPVQESFLIVLVWFLLGCVGLPVFIGGGAGVAYLVAPYGAYTMSYPIIAVVIPLIRGARYNRIRYTISSIIGIVLIDIIGMLYLMHAMSYNLVTGFSLGFAPFIILDIIKAVVAAQIIPQFRKIIAE